MRRYQTPCGMVGDWHVSILSVEDPRKATPGSVTGSLTIRRVCWGRAGCGASDETEVAFENIVAVAFEISDSDEPDVFDNRAAVRKIASVQPPTRCPICRALEEG